VPIVLKSGSLNLLESSGPLKACNGIALPIYYNTTRWFLSQFFYEYLANYFYSAMFYSQSRRLRSGYKSSALTQEHFRATLIHQSPPQFPSSFMAQQPLEGQGLPAEASLSHSVGLPWTSDQPDAETPTWQHTALKTDTQATDGIRNRNPNKRAAAGPRFGSRGYRSRPPSYHIAVTFIMLWLSPTYLGGVNKSLKLAVTQ
jgi:hypothetical protein